METGKTIAEKNGTRDLVLEMSKLEQDSVTSKKGEYPNAPSLMAKSSFSMDILVGSSPRNLELAAAQQENLRYRGQNPTLESSASTEGNARPKQDKPPSSPEKPHATKKEYDEKNPDLIATKKSSKWTFWVIIEWIIFVCSVCCLIAGLTLQKLENLVIWGLELWKYCVLVLVIFCGRLYTRWMMIAVLRRKLLLNEKVLYFIYGVRIGVRFFVWLCFVLLAWIFLVDHGVHRTKETIEVLNDIRRALYSSLVGVAIWLLKTLFVKIIAASYQGKRFFDAIKKAIFHCHVVDVLLRAPRAKSCRSIAWLAQVKPEDVITWLKKMNKEKEFIDVISDSKLSLAEDKDIDHRDTSKQERQADKIFKNLGKPNDQCIEEEDLIPYFDKKELQDVLQDPLLEVESGGGIKIKALEKLISEVYNERKSLACSLKDSKTAIEELNRLASGVVLIVIMVVWLLLMGFLTTKILLLIGTQLLLVVFMIGNTLRTVFEAIIFVFVVHPFDVSDRCIIDGVQMIVEEVNLLTTVFLKFDKQKIYYPNSVLATKPIGNFYRSPEKMGDTVEFAIDVSTSVQQIKALEKQIEKYLKENPECWLPDYNLVVKDFDDVNKIKMVLFVNHTINFHNYMERNVRRSELILELKTSLEDLQIKYHMLPLQAHLIGSLFPPAA